MFNVHLLSERCALPPTGDTDDEQDARVLKKGEQGKKRAQAG